MADQSDESVERRYCICQQRWDPQDPTFMIECNACHDWFHGDCVDVTETEANKFVTWNCPNCSMFHGPPQLKMGLRRRKRKIDFAALNEAPADNSGGADLLEVDYAARIRNREKAKSFKDADGCIKIVEIFNDEYVNRHGFEQPVLVKEKSPALGLQVPDQESFSVTDVATLGGVYRTLTVIDVSTQVTLEYSLKDWADYFATPPIQRDRVLNSISFEFSKTPLDKLVTAPRVAREVDFVNLHWPKSESHDEDALDRPHVSKYCLMSAAGSFTDFHIDFGGTSVWYHIFQGEKIFYFIRPTAENVKIYSEWSINGRQSKDFLCDLVSECYQVRLLAGHTLFIPSGWIHAVFTPKDSLVFGGNFVHKYSLEMQLRIFNLERKLKVDGQYKFPNYEALMWYAASDFVKKSITDIKAQPLHVLKGFKVLLTNLRKWCKSKKSHQDQYPKGVDVASVVASLESVLSQCVLKAPKPPKPPRPAKEKKKTKKKEREPRKKTKKTGVVFWAQCDQCDEWRIIQSPLLDDRAKFFCVDAGHVCAHQKKLDEATSSVGTGGDTVEMTKQESG